MSPTTPGCVTSCGPPRSASTPIDVLVNNAGHCYRAAVGEVADDQVQELFATNFFGPAALIQAVLPGMRERRSGTIVNISSGEARSCPVGAGHYVATKAALEALTASLRKEVEPLGITVMAVEPGAFRTNYKYSLISPQRHEGGMTMKHIKLGGLEVSRTGLGAMGMSAACTGAGTDDAESIRTIYRALELGVTLSRSVMSALGSNRLRTTCQCCAQGKDAARPTERRRWCAIGICCRQVLAGRTLKDVRDTLRAALANAVALPFCSQNRTQLLSAPWRRRIGGGLTAAA